MNKLQQKLLDLKISKKLPFWCIAPALIICVFVIVFAVTGAKTDAATGFGLGIDRLTMLIFGLHINEAMFLFRSPKRLTP